MVSVCLITYNHAPYIRECLDSMLMQETNFPFEICIGEDESTDGTREICIEYAEKYPGLINLILRSRSAPGRDAYVSQGVYNYIETTKACRGKYVAMCDGDDAWTDPLKLQKQFDVMETDPSVSLVHSDFDQIDEVSGRRTKGVFRRRNIIHRVNLDTARFKCDVILRHYPVSPCTAFMRTQDVVEIFDKTPEAFQTLPMGDTTTWCELVDYGSFRYLDEAHGMYRVLPESDSNSRSAERRYRFVNKASNLGLILGEKYNLPMDAIRAFKIKSCNRYALLSGDLSEIGQLYASDEYRFSFGEKIIFQVNHLKIARALVKKVFQLKYKINNRLFNLS